MDFVKTICSLIFLLMIYLTFLSTLQLFIKTFTINGNNTLYKELLLNLTIPESNTSCHDILLNLSNPFSYINKVTKPFLIELVNNASARNLNIKG
jgi:hypothetical protein